jgi:oxalate decarboxylase/phosphoglucose isomerase-like protein (cupin superfamily)
MNDKPRPGNEMPYENFMDAEDIPVHRAVLGVSDITQLRREPWQRTGGLGTFIELHGTFQSERGLFVGEIPPRAELRPQKYLYEQQLYILQGSGATSVWQGDPSKVQSFEWERGSVFAIPPNVDHVLTNAGDEAVVYFGVTTAPRIMNSLYDIAATFDSTHRFVDLDTAEGDYFLSPEERSVKGWYQQTMVDTRLIRNVYDFVADPQEQKVAGGRLTGYRMGPRFPRGHISTWPSGRYHKAHYHGPGAIILGLDGEGYVLAWDSAFGPRPYANGHGDRVEKLAWGAHSIYAPPNRYFHQHFNTSAGEARHVAVYGAALPLGVHDLNADDGWRGHKSIREGGTLIEYEDEDPRVRADFDASLRENGLESTMPPVTYVD